MRELTDRQEQELRQRCAAIAYALLTVQLHNGIALVPDAQMVDSLVDATEQLAALRARVCQWAREREWQHADDTADR